MARILRVVTKSVILRYGLIVACLCLATLAVLEGSWRFEIRDDNLTIEPPERVPSTWTVSPEGVSTAPAGEDSGLILDADAARGVPYVTAVLRRSGSFGHLRITADLKIEGLRIGHDQWKRVGLIIISLGESLRTIGYWPKRVFTLDEDQDWRGESQVFPLHESTEGFRLILYNAALDGRVWLRRIELVPLYERELFVGLRYLLGVLWAALFGLCAWALLGLDGRKAPKAALVLLFGVATAAIIMPQPHYGRIVHLVEGIATDLTTQEMWSPTQDDERGAQEQGSPDEPEPEPEPELEPEPEAEADPEPEPSSPGGQPGVQAEDQTATQAEPAPRRGAELRIGSNRREDSWLFEWLSFKEIAHFSMFLLLALLSLWIFRRGHRLAVLVFLLLYAVSTEFLQLFIATRSTSILDLLVNTLGIATGALAHLIWQLALRTAPDQARQLK